ncbi:MAG: Fur family ferric uptake transcriptional regulator [Myxococcota bacterium]|jgi:Fur family ferric uptake transcriptional regulator
MANPARLRKRFEEHLERNNLKQTRQRRAILDTFLDSKKHVAVEDLAEAVQSRMQGIGHATIYRTMKLFTDAGIAHERNFGDGQTRYEPVVHGEHHDHLICEDCGHIFEFEDQLIEDRQELVAQQHGLTLSSHRHDIYGRCEARSTCPRWAAQQ